MFHANSAVTLSRLLPAAFLALLSASTAAAQAPVRSRTLELFPGLNLISMPLAVSTSGGQPCDAASALRSSCAPAAGLAAAPASTCCCPRPTPPLPRPSTRRTATWRASRSPATSTSPASTCPR
jgi:hypothetical protein